MILELIGIYAAYKIADKVNKRKEKEMYLKYCNRNKNED